MKLTPRSIALRTIRRLSCSSTVGRPRCQPPSPIADTRSPVRPSARRGIGSAEFSAMSVSPGTDDQSKLESDQATQLRDLGLNARVLIRLPFAIDQECKARANQECRHDQNQ